MKRALLIVDVQRDFCEPNGSLAVSGSESIIGTINELSQRKDIYSLIIYTKDWHPPNHCSFASNHGSGKPFTQIQTDQGTTLSLWPDHCIQNTIGSEFHQKLRVEPNALIVYKGTLSNHETFSGFGTTEEYTEMINILNSSEITAIDIVGLALDFCVKCTACDGLKHGFRPVRIIREGVRAANPSAEVSTFEELENLGIDIISITDLCY